MTRKIRPNLFIVGAMKCGTTILSDYLSEHPRVVIAKGKEVHYFTLNSDKGESWYLDHFDGDDETRYAVDASPTYFDTCNSALIPKLIKSFSPDAKIIILIRDPVERALSHYNHLVKIDKVPVFQGKTFADLLNDDLLKSMLGSDAQAFYLDLIVNFSSYYKKIAHFAAVFGKDKILVLHNEDLRHHGKLVMKRVFDFLELEPIESDSFSKQKYVHGTKNSLSFAKEYELYKLYSQDYIASCAHQGVQRFKTPDIVSYDNPSGAVVGDIAIGDDGWLFLAEGANDFIKFFTVDDAKTKPLIDQWVDRIRDRQTRLAKSKIKYMNIFIPEKLSVYYDRLPWSLDPQKSPGRSFFRQAPESLRDINVNLFGIFASIKNERQLYYKTDSHWNHVGAFLAYQAICHKLDIKFDPELLKRPSHSGEIVLDLGSKLSPPRKERATFHHFVMNAELAQDGDLVKYKKETNRLNDGGLHVGSLVHYKNSKARTKRRAILFGDSFSEYRDHLLTGLLAETFAEFIFVWSTSMDYALIESFRPDVVLTAMTERFMTRVPDDQFDVRAYARDVVAREKAADAAKAR